MPTKFSQLKLNQKKNISHQIIVEKKDTKWHKKGVKIKIIFLLYRAIIFIFRALESFPGNGKRSRGIFMIFYFCFASVQDIKKF
jgi:hypothetical protein